MVVTIIEMTGPAAPPRDVVTTAGYRLGLVAVRSELLAVCRLRDLVFGLEGGATTPGPDGLDLDRFDDLCDHLVVWWSDGVSAEIPVATYRLLPPSAVRTSPRRDSLYTATEFDLAPIEDLLPESIEAGRACVHPAHRNATTISLLWRGIARYAEAAGTRYLLGCASFSDRDGGVAAADFVEYATRRHLMPELRQVRPRRAFALPRGPRNRPDIPPLLRGYLRLGATVSPEPAWDETFGTIDFLVLLDLATADRRYLDFFTGSAGPLAGRAADPVGT